MEDIKFQVLDNDDEFHCEVNMLYKNKKETTEGSHYFGISKLSCFLCEIILSTNTNIKYAGTHGLFFSYNIDKILEDNPNVASRLIENMRKVLLEHQKEFFEESLKGCNDDVINCFLLIPDDKLVEIFNHIIWNEKSSEVLQSSHRYLVSGKEEEIAGFHPENLDKPLSDYTTYLSGEIN